MIIRPRTYADDTEWLRMRFALWPDASPDTQRAEMSTWLSSPNTGVLVAQRDPGPGLAGFAEIGERSFADGCETGPVAYLEGWYVDLDMRRQGIGTALVRAAENWARQRGYSELASDVELDNVPSQQAHAALGFEEIVRTVVYRKVL